MSTTATGTAQTTAMAPAVRGVWDIRAKLLSVMPQANERDRERFVHALVSMLNQVKDIERCDSTSVLRSAYTIAKLGLNPEPAMGQVCIVPRMNRKTNVTVAQVQIEYRGFIELARRSRRVADVHAEVVFDNEHCQVRLGTARKIDHAPWYSFGQAGPGTLCLAYVTWTDLDSGAPQFHVINRTRIERAKKSSQTAGGAYSPWDTDEAAMWRKTAIIDASRFWPLSVELAQAVRLENQAASGEQQELDEPEADGTKAMPTGGSLDEYDNDAEELIPSAQRVRALIVAHANANGCTLDEATAELQKIAHGAQVGLPADKLMDEMTDRQFELLESMAAKA